MKVSDDGTGRGPEMEREPTSPASVAALPLVVDVDGTLIRTDLLHETALQFIARHPARSWQLPVWLAGGKQRLKCELAEQSGLDIDTIPLRAETLERIQRAQRDGRDVYLASASETGLVRRLADRIGGIAGVFGTDRTINAAGARKSAILNAAFGKGGYDYIGDRAVDFDVWPSAANVIAVSHSDGFSRALKRRHPDAEIVANPRPVVRQYVKAMRTHQWAKNLLVFLSPIVGHHFDVPSIIASILAFACFCMAASSAYMINDLLDLPGDRVHVRKRFRPFAAGDVPITHGLIMAALLMTGAIALATALPIRFLVVLLCYVGFTLGYSLLLKRKLLIDVIVLGGLYTLRVLGGVVASGERQSTWLLMFSLFLFLCLAIVKRCSELVALRDAGRRVPPGRGYEVNDLAVLLPLGAASGYCTVLVVTQYFSSPEVVALYSHAQRLWLICPLLMYWVSRVLVISNRGNLHDDPVIFALTDKVSWIVASLVALIIFAAI